MNKPCKHESFVKNCYVCELFARPGKDGDDFRTFLQGENPSGRVCGSLGKLVDFEPRACCGLEMVGVHECQVFEFCTPSSSVPGRQSCGICDRYQAKAKCSFAGQVVSEGQVQCLHPDKKKRMRHLFPTPADCGRCQDREIVPMAEKKCSNSRSSDSIEETVRFIKECPPGPWPDGWATWDNVIEAHRLVFREKITKIPPYPVNKFTGKGIVISGGIEANDRLSHGYGPCIWVLVNELRRVGCDLPIQVWHMGPMEMDPYFAKLLGGLGVECVDAHEFTKHHPARILCGWELKVYSTIWSPFEEVLFLDADNSPAGRDPSFLFREGRYKDHGAIFWPDYDGWRLDPGVWKIFALPFHDEAAFESGQYLVNKRKWWRAINTAMILAEHSDFCFRHFYGDKETFHIGARMTGQSYAMPCNPGWFTHTIVQHDFEGKHLFYHRVQDKWKLNGGNRPLSELIDEPHRFQCVSDLARIWSGIPWSNPVPNARERQAISRLKGRKFLYKRVGFDERHIVLSANGKVGIGSADCERRWEVHESDGKIVLALCGNIKPTCILTEDEQGTWKGKWLRHEQMQVELVPVAMSQADESEEIADLTVQITSTLSRNGIEADANAIRSFLRNKKRGLQCF